MRVILAAAMALAILTVPARAQIGAGKEKSQLDLIYEAKERERADTEKAYNETVRRTRESGPATKVDPWRTIRPADNNSKR